MSPGSIVFNGIGHWISLIFQPAGSFHFASVGRPASPENFQYVCQPGAIRSSNPTMNGLPGTTAVVSASSSGFTSCFPWYVWPRQCGARTGISHASIKRTASLEASLMLLPTTRARSQQSMGISGCHPERSEGPHMSSLITLAMRISALLL